MKADKKRFVELLRSGDHPIVSACAQIGKAPVTIWRWRQADLAFDAEVTVAQQDSDRIRVGNVEDGLYARILKGKAAPAETIFFLVNRSNGRWRHIQRIEHTGKAGENLPPAQVHVYMPSNGRSHSRVS